MTRQDRLWLLRPLLDALEVERHCRAPLVRNVLEELGELGPDSAELHLASASLRGMLVELEARTMPDESYRKCLASTRRLVELVTHPTKLLA